MSKKIGRLKQKYSKASKHYKIEVTKDEKSGNAVKIRWTRQIPPDTKDGLPGVYCPRTSLRKQLAGQNRVTISMQCKNITHMPAVKFLQQFV